MKQLRSTSYEMRAIFQRDLTVVHVMEPLISREASESAGAAKQFMIAQDFDVVGLSDNGTVVGYMRREDLTEGICGQFRQELTPDTLVADSTPLFDLLLLLQKKPRYFVLTGNRVAGIVMRGDLQKAPVRMLIFGLVTLVEMNLLKTIRHHFPEDGWKTMIKKARIDEAQKLLDNRRKRNEALDLADCLQLADKFDIVRKEKDLLANLRFSATKLDKLKKYVEGLRNRLAHGNDLVSGSSWEEVIDTAVGLERLLIQLEEGTEASKP